MDREVYYAVYIFGCKEKKDEGSPKSQWYKNIMFNFIAFFLYQQLKNPIWNIVFYFERNFDVLLSKDFFIYKKLKLFYFSYSKYFKATFY